LGSEFQPADLDLAQMLKLLRSKRKAGGGGKKEEQTAIADVETKEAADGTEAEEAADTLQAGGGKTGGGLDGWREGRDLEASE
jgi:hypothetical protein